MVGCAKREGRGTEGRGLYLRGSLGAALCESHSFFLRSSEDLSFLDGGASRPREEEHLDVALGRRGGERAQ